MRSFFFFAAAIARSINGCATFSAAACGFKMIVDPPREERRFHRSCPRLRQRLHPQVQIQPRGWNLTFPVNLAAAVLHAVTDLLLVNIQPDVIHRLHGGASFGVSESARSLSSAFVHQALLLRLMHSNKSGTDH